MPILEWPAANDESIPTAAQFLLIIGTFTFWTQLPHGTQLMDFISQIIQAYGPRAMAYLADKKISNPENEEIADLYRSCENFLQRNGYIPEPLPCKARVDIIHGLTYLLFIGPPMLAVQIITDLDWQSFQGFLQQWLTKVHPNGHTNWEVQGSQVKHIISMVIAIISHRNQLYKSCKQMFTDFPLAMIEYLPVEIKHQFSDIMGRRLHAHFRTLTEDPNTARLRDEMTEVADFSSNSESENSSPTHSSMPALEFSP